MMIDIHLDKELYDLLFTDNITQRIARPLLWVKFRRDEQKERIRCPSCNNGKTGYREGQYGCPYCKGKGYLWDELIIEGYIYKKGDTRDKMNYVMNNKVGRLDTTSYVLVTMKDVKPRMGDSISVLELMPDGKIAVPIVKEETSTVIYDRTFKASQLGTDFNSCIIGG